MDSIEEKSLVSRMAGKVTKDRMAKIENFAEEDVDYWYDANFNPFGENIGDCMIRAVSAAIMMRYECVCGRLGYRFKDGRGLERQTGANLHRIMASSLKRYFEPADRDALMIHPGMTLRSFIDVASSTVPAKGSGQGLYVVFAADPKSGTGHAIYVCAGQNGDRFFIDTFDSADYVVGSALKVKHQVGKNNPERLKYGQFRAIQELYRDKKAVGPDMFEMFLNRMFAPKSGEAEYDLDDQMREWLAADSKDEMVAMFRKLGANQSGMAAVIADAAGKPLPERIEAAAKILNGDFNGDGSGFPYSLKSYPWFESAEAENIEDVRGSLPTVFVNLKTTRDITDTDAWNRLKDRSFAVMKDLNLDDEVKRVVYRQTKERGTVWFDFTA